MLASIGLTPEPCGLPEYVSWYVHCSIYPALRNFHISDMNASSFMRFLKSCIVIWWSKLSKQALMSPSIIHFAPVNSVTISFNAVWQLLFGLKPCELSENVGS